MYILYVGIHIKPGLVDAFKAATLDNVRETLKEDGVVRFDLICQADDATRFALFEVYRDARDHILHKDTLHYRRWSQAVEAMLVEPRTRTIYESVFPEQSGWVRVT